MPFPGDDQGSIIYSALSGLGNADEPIAKAEEASSAATGSSPPGSRVLDGSQNNGAPPEDPKSKGPIPHRWVIVGAMALAFVLCNMDKVLPPSLFLPGMLNNYCASSIPEYKELLMLDICDCSVRCIPAGEHVGSSDTHGSRPGVEPQ